MNSPATALPWAQSDSRPDLLFHDSVGMIDVKQPIGRFKNPQDAEFVIGALDCLTELSEQITALRSAFGAPGDWGYDSPQGQALFAIYKSGAVLTHVMAPPKPAKSEVTP
ncbi:hypothetical protein [Ancylobacter defluvii]|uniref:Uncharacterized protein n=1 Tax=Ancylobacter defluvii TaxID=1282440 RepID=A0A9W6K023_9HYPH|nr:hypothetical protein [Ancylobacter defluvii]MBS7586435.1 hypothetical protein [Ancylobacter defluvii]GLK85716.1 hypothetical protein GCM10017653_37860 [Ancylobacter defluvii]